MDYRALNILRGELTEWLAAKSSVDGTQTARGSNLVLSSQKNARSENQDRAIFISFSSPDEQRAFELIAVLDGIGGMVDGGSCADLCVCSLVMAMVSMPRRRNRVTLVEALSIANTEVYRKYGGRGGTTFAGVFIERNQPYAINIGDSHVYDFQPGTALTQRSTDDRLGIQFAKLKGLENVELNPELSRRLAQYVGMQGVVSPHVSPLSSELLHSPDVFMILATDGASAQDFTERVLPLENANPQIVASLLMDKSAAVSESDNATVICARGVALRPKLRPNWSPFEHLQVTSIHGVFNFLIPNTEPTAIRGEYGRRVRERQKRIENVTPASSKASGTPVAGNEGKANIPKSSLVEKNEPEEIVKPQVTIRQLTFDPTPDEPAK